MVYRINGPNRFERIVPIHLCVDEMVEEVLTDGRGTTASVPDVSWSVAKAFWPDCTCEQGGAADCPRCDMSNEEKEERMLTNILNYLASQGFKGYVRFTFLTE